MYELKELKGPLRNSLYKNLNTWIQENNLDGDPHDFVDTKELLNQNKDEQQNRNIKHRFTKNTYK